MLPANTYQGEIGIMADSSAPPQHIYVPKLIIYVSSSCGNHSMWVWGLNQCTMTSFVVAWRTPKNIEILPMTQKYLSIIR
jgi:hypothetical protein